MAHVFTAGEKARIALEALKGIESISQIASAHKAHPIQVEVWKKTLSEKAQAIFDNEHNSARRIKEMEATIGDLYRIIGERDAELVWLKKKFGT